MNIWVYLWIFIAIILIGLFIWTNFSLMQQKKAWKEFARKNGLKYYPNGFLKSPLVYQKTKNFVFRLFSEEQFTDDIGRRRFTTVLEWILPAMPTSGVIASSTMKQLVSLARVTDRIKNPPGEWSKKDFIIAEDSLTLMPYLTKERMAELRKLVRMKNCRFLYAFDTQQGVMRIETIDPLLKEDKITPVYKKMRQAVSVLKPTDEDFEEVDKALEQIQRKRDEIQSNSHDTQTAPKKESQPEPPLDDGGEEAGGQDEDQDKN